ncbi:MAG: aminotransferase class IV [Chloroflexota bacterium]|nr:aminotransferase class IV [Chloroflexota bacterium]MDE2909860.1 aminotransferase class IV [Chloroflexota bacterium]
MSVFYIDGEYMEAAEARVPATDLAILRGFGVFDALRTYGGFPFQLGAHLRRLMRSAALIDLACPWDIEELGDIVLEAVKRNGFPESNIRIIVTGGEGERSFLPLGDSRLLVMVTPCEAPPASWYEDGVHLATTELHRHLPEAKTINYIPAIMAQRAAIQRDPKAIEAIYISEGIVSEGTRSNTFIFKKDRWITPKDGLLLGITRAEAIKLLEAEGVLELRDITLDEYRAADEIILTSSTKEIVPVVRVDDATIGAGLPGEMTRRLMRQWRAMTEAYAAAGIVL